MEFTELNGVKLVARLSDRLRHFLLLTLLSLLYASEEVGSGPSGPFGGDTVFKQFCLSRYSLRGPLPRDEYLVRTIGLRLRPRLPAFVGAERGDQFRALGIEFVFAARGRGYLDACGASHVPHRQGVRRVSSARSFANALRLGSQAPRDGGRKVGRPRALVNLQYVVQRASQGLAGREIAKSGEHLGGAVRRLLRSARGEILNDRRRRGPCPYLKDS
jgi:hypothetical protein